ncbi:MAG: GIY-YIG nuclease family protein [bacterium]
MRQYYVYILASRSRRLYVGFTNELLRRTFEHKNGMIPGFTKQFNINCLVYFEATSHALAGIEREKQIKRWTRERKFYLIERHNPEWRDLSEGWYN